MHFERVPFQPNQTDDSTKGIHSPEFPDQSHETAEQLDFVSLLSNKYFHGSDHITRMRGEMLIMEADNLLHERIHACKEDLSKEVQLCSAYRMLNNMFVVDESFIESLVEDLMALHKEFISTKCIDND